MNIYKKLTANIFIGERLSALSLRPRTRQGRMSASLFLLSIILEVLASTKRQVKETKCMQIAKEEMKLFLFANDTTVYTENTKESRETSQK